MRFVILFISNHKSVGTVKELQRTNNTCYKLTFSVWWTRQRTTGSSHRKQNMSVKITCRAPSVSYSASWCKQTYQSKACQTFTSAFVTKYPLYCIFQSLGHDDFAGIIKTEVATVTWHTAHGTSSLLKHFRRTSHIRFHAVGLHNLNLDLQGNQRSVGKSDLRWIIRVMWET